MSAASIVLSMAGSGVWAAAVTRRAWLAVAWSRAGQQPGVAGAVVAFGLGEHGGGLGRGSGGECEPRLAGQGGEDRGELPGGVAGEVDDRGEAGGQRRAGAQQAAERACLPGQDHGQVIAPLGQLLVQAAEHLLAAIGQAAPGVRIGDHHDPPGGAPDRLAHQHPGLPEGRADHAPRGHLIHVPRRQQPQLGVDARDSPGRPGLARTRAAGEDEVLPRGPRDRHAGLTAGPFRPQDGDPSPELPGDRLQAREGRPGRPYPARSPRLALGRRSNAVMFPSSLPSQPAVRPRCARP